jgi:hypothetical protein
MERCGTGHLGYTHAQQKSFTFREKNFPARVGREGAGPLRCQLESAVHLHAVALNLQIEGLFADSEGFCRLASAVVVEFQNLFDL